VQIYSADKAFEKIALNKELLSQADLEDLKEQLDKRREDGTWLAIEELAMETGTLDAKDIKRILKSRARYGRHCLDCREITYLLPKQRSSKVRCEYCEGQLESGRIDGTRSHGFRAERRTRALEALGLLVGFDLAGTEAGEQDDAPTENDADLENYGVDDADPDFWNKPDESLSRLSFDTHVNMSEDEAFKVPEPIIARPETSFQKLSRRFTSRFGRPRKKSKKREDKPPSRLRRVTNRLFRRRNDAVEPLIVLINDTNWKGYVVSLIVGPLAMSGLLILCGIVIEQYAYTVSPKYEGMQQGITSGATGDLSPLWVGIFTIFTVIIGNFGMYFGNSTSLGMIAQWPIKSTKLRVLLSVTSGVLIFFALDIIFERLLKQGWNELSYLIYFQLLGMLLSYRFLIFGLGQRWDTINNRM
jgi:hypothetical protein